MYWLFHNEQLDKALAEFSARRQREGASEQQALDDAALIKLFLVSDEAARAKLIGGAR
jgi:nicotinic acid phosphoribosyltransferase